LTQPPTLVLITPPLCPPSKPCSIQAALLEVIGEGKYRTGDLGGVATTSDFTKAVIDKL
jgi:isocitrate/isopropylmalate dehydrogenase